VLVAESSGVSQSVMTTAIFVYKTAFSSGDFGTASAISWLLFLIIASTTWVNNRVFSRNERKEANR
jgi:multiple sugar transport system permease protein